MLDSYLAELEKIKLLSPEEERALWQAYKEHDDESARTALLNIISPLFSVKPWRIIALYRM